MYNSVWVMQPAFITSNGWTVIKTRPRARLCQFRVPNYEGKQLVQSRLSLPRPSVVFVTPDNFSKNVEEAVKLAEACFRAQVTLIQIRDGKGTKEDIERVVEGLLSADIPCNRLIVNGLPPEQVAAMDRGLGVHIKEKDITTYLQNARDVLGEDPIIGCAVHSPDTAKLAAKLHMPDYFQVGTMFATMSHPGKIPEGPKLLGEIRGVVGKDSMLIGIGGIEENNVAEIMKNNGDGVAVVTSITRAEDPEATVFSLFESCRAAYHCLAIT